MPQPRGSPEHVDDQGEDLTASMRSSARSSVRTRLLRLSALFLAASALVLSAISASADVLNVPLIGASPNPGCGPLDVSCEAIAAGNLVPSGTFNIAESGNVDACFNGFTCVPLENKLC